MLQLMTDRSAISTEMDVAVDVLVRIVPEIPVEQADRPPLNLALVLDRSGSMAGEKIRLTCQAASRAVESLLDGDRISIVLFDHSVKVLVSQAQASQKANALALLAGVGTGGQTALFDGWTRGGEEVLNLVDQQRMNRVVLLTDGEANVGETGVDPICTAVSQVARQGVQTTTLGFGSGYNEDLLRAMAASGDGNHFYVESSEQLEPFLEMELSGLRATQGKQVRLSVKPLGSVVPVWLGTAITDEQGDLKLSDLISHCPLQRVLRLMVPAGHQGPLAEVVLRWVCPRQGRVQNLVQELCLPAVAREDWLRLPIQAVVAVQVAVARLAQLREQAMACLKSGDKDKAMELLQEARQLHLPEDERGDLDDLIDTFQRGDYGSGHKKAAMYGHGYSSGHGSGHYKKEPTSNMPIRIGRLLGWAPGAEARAWNRVEGMLRGLFYGDRLGLGPRPALGEASSLTVATLQSLRRQPFHLPDLLEAWSQAPVLHPSPSLKRMRAGHAQGKAWAYLGGDTAGCGALRRMAPLLVPHCVRPQPSLWREVGTATAVTHKNNAALVASLGVSKMLWELLAMAAMPDPGWYQQHFLEWSLDLEDGRSYPCHGPAFRNWRGTLCQFVLSAISDARLRGLSASQAMQGWGSGPYVLEMVPSWLYILERHGSEPQAALEIAVTNTIEPQSLGALVGAALGALHGPQPGWDLTPELEMELALVRDRWF